MHSIGNPGKSGALWVYASGSVRSIYPKDWRVKEGERIHDFKAKVLETQSPTNPGDSGGPLVNDKGEMIGITQGYAPDAQLLSLFIDISEVRTFLRGTKLLGRLPTSPKAGATGTSEDKTIVAVPDQDKEEKQEKRAASKLQFAKTLAEDGKIDKAKDRFEAIIADAAIRDRIAAVPHAEKVVAGTSEDGGSKLQSADHTK